MAREILRDGSAASNRPTHNLESLFFVLLWICSNYSGPSNAVRGDEKRKDIPIMMWADTQSTLEMIGDLKSGHICNEENFNKRILDYYAPYFEDLKECSNELRRLFTPASDIYIDVTHDAMLVVLRRTFFKLKPEYDSEGQKGHTAEDEEEQEEDEDEDEEEEEEEEGDLNLRPLRFLPHTMVTRVQPQAAITTYPFGRARSSSPCLQYTHAHPR
jgi:hypothetical protein